jgi:four helix bundle protein
MSDYKKLLVWQKAKELAVQTYVAVREDGISRNYGLKDQILRAVVSIASNIAEGYTRESAPDRKHFLTIARGSCSELETQLIIAKDVGLLSANTADNLIDIAIEVSKMLFALRKNLYPTVK